MEHLFGTDEFDGTCLRIVHCARISLVVALVSVVFLLVPVPGAVRGIMAVSSIIISSVTDRVVFSRLFAYSSPYLPGSPECHNSHCPGKLVGILPRGRGQFLSLKREFIEAARVLGMSDLRIIFGHILPNALTPVVVMATLELPKAIVIEASLSFLGLGAQPPTPSWGVILDSGKGLLDQAPWISFFPGLMIMIVVLGFNLFGDALRDVLDPNSH